MKKKKSAAEKKCALTRVVTIILLICAVFFAVLIIAEISYYPYISGEIAYPDPDIDIPGSFFEFWTAVAMFVAIAGSLFFFAIQNLRWLRAFNLYAPLLARGREFLLKDLVARTGKPERQVKKSMGRLIKKGLFPGAYIDQVRNRIIFSDVEVILEGKARAEIRYHVVDCPGCGAKNNVPEGGGICEYCGRMLGSG